MTTAQARSRGWRHRLAAVPLDLLGVVGLALLVDALVVAALGGPVVRFLLGSAFLFFVPGYALVSALYPQESDSDLDRRTVGVGAGSDGLTVGERLAVSVGASVALIPVVAVGLGGLGLLLTQETVLGSVTVLTVTFAVIGALRRLRLDPNHRFTPFAGDRPRGDGRGHGRRRSRRSSLLVAGLVVAVGLAGGMFAYGIAAEPLSAPYTSASLLTTTDGGDFVASGYPANATVGEPTSLTVRVDNERPTATNVTVVGALERVDENGTIHERDRLVTLQNEVGPDGRWNATHEVVPTFAGENLRLAYYVYDGPVPDTVGPQTASREIYHRIDVED